jgi:hypothetical protein
LLLPLQIRGSAAETLAQFAASNSSIGHLSPCRPRAGCRASALDRWSDFACCAAMRMAATVLTGREISF